MNGTLVDYDAVYYADSEVTADLIGHIGIVQPGGVIRSLIGSYSLSDPGPNDVVVKVDELKAFLGSYVTAAKASPYYSQEDSGLRRVIEGYEQTGYFSPQPTEALLAVFRQVASGYDRVHQVVFYEYFLGDPAPQVI